MNKNIVNKTLTDINQILKDYNYNNYKYCKIIDCTWILLDLKMNAQEQILKSLHQWHQQEHPIPATYRLECVHDWGFF